METEFRWVTISSRHELISFYNVILPNIRESAKSLGYAIGVHGSMLRDLDLIAIPWTSEAVDKDALAGAVQKAACGLVSQNYQWEAKPNGRMATYFPVCFADFDHGIPSLGHIDLSVMPKTDSNQAS